MKTGMEPPASEAKSRQRFRAAPCSAYTVTGWALVPCKIEITVDAKTPVLAMAKAKRVFQAGPRRQKWIVKGSEDVTSVCDFEPFDAMPPISLPNVQDHRHLPVAGLMPERSD